MNEFPEMPTNVEKLFELFWAMGDNRSTAEIAKRQGVTPRTVQRYAKKYGWADLIAEREATSLQEIKKAVKEADQEAQNQAIIEATEYNKMLSEMVHHAYERFKEGKIIAKSFADVERIMKMDMDYQRFLKEDDQGGSGEVDNITSLANAITSMAHLVAPPKEDDDQGDDGGYVKDETRRANQG
ncbi:hypothetical protein H7T43_09235 [Peribacillus simplex]|uniref:hypothetical protein n=1 Tax=Peribacillus simplex TaxID=1478 RepID=UPI002989C8EA|nr:hypothetical protein [Peribacillus simplex]MBX9955098.1 hypothetical protein [Peribacillus simplex]